MNAENGQKLIECFPEAFQGQHPARAFPMFGFECGNGWFELLKDLLNEMRQLCEHTKNKIRVSQIKEKYGTLRFYWDNVTEFEDGIECAENALFMATERAGGVSGEICEECGKPGKLRRPNYWYFTACEDCFSKHMKDHDQCCASPCQ
jgi:hypothetical protein